MLVGIGPVLMTASSAAIGPMARSRNTTLNAQEVAPNITTFSRDGLHGVAVAATADKVTILMGRIGKRRSPC